VALAKMCESLEQGGLTPVVLPRNSCSVKGAGMRMGLSASSGISEGIGRTARIECRMEILCSGSSEADECRMTYKVVGMSCKMIELKLRQALYFRVGFQRE
jgi:hypothetical protein